MEIFEMLGKIVVNAGEAVSDIDRVTGKAKEAEGVLNQTFSTMGNGLVSSIDTVANQSVAALERIGTTATNVGNKLTSSITKPALAAGTAVAGVFLTKGFQRLTAIDDARGKLQALGHSAETVDVIMDNALASVKGTAFGLGDAATAAASAVAAGIEPGQELERYLGLIGDTAAIAGAEFSDMGAIFNKVMTSGVIQAEELNQISDRGVPIFQMLADEMGVTAGEVKKLASEGKISSDIFLDAMEQLESSAGVIGATTLSAAMDNVWASVGRVGAAFLDAGGQAGGFFGQLKPLMAELTDGIDNLAPLAEDLGVKFGNAFASMLQTIKDLKTAFDELDEESKEKLLSMAKTISLVLIGIGPFLQIVGGLATAGAGAAGGLGKLVSVTKKLAIPLTKAGGAIATFATFVGKIGPETKALSEGLAGISKGFAGLATAVSGAIQVIGGLSILGVVGVAIGGVIALLGLLPEEMRNNINEMLGIAENEGPKIIENLANGIRDRIPELMTLGSEILVNLMDAITANLPALAGLAGSIIEGIAQGFSENGEQLATTAISMLLELGSAIAQNIPALAELGATMISGLASGIANNAEGILDLALQIIESLILAFIEEAPQLASAAVELIQGLITGIENNEDKIDEMVTTIIEALKTSFAENPEGWNAVGLIMLAGLALSIAKNALIAMAPAAISVVGAFAASLVSAPFLIFVAVASLIGFLVYQLAKHWDEVKEAGVQLAQKLKDGIEQTKEELKTLGTEISTRFQNGVNQTWQELVSVGEWIIEKLKNGIEQTWDEIKTFGKTVADKFVTGVEGFASTLVSAGEGIVNNIKQGISNAWSGLVTWFDTKLQGLRNKLPFSPPKDKSSPLAGLEKNGIVHQIVEGLKRQAPLFDKAMDSIFALTMPKYDAQVSLDYMTHYKQTATNDDLTVSPEAIMQSQLSQVIELLMYILDATEVVSNKEFATYLDGRSLATGLRTHLVELDILTGERDARLRGERFA